MVERVDGTGIPARDGDCRKSRALLSEWLDHDLPPRTSRAVTAHLSACTRCHSLVGALRIVLSELTTLAGPGPGQVPARRGPGTRASVRRPPRIKWFDD